MAQVIISNLPPAPAGTGSGTSQGTDLFPATDTTDTSVTQPTGTTKKYTLSEIFNFMLSAQGLTTYSAVRVATTTALNAAYANGSSGVGATLTNAGAQVALAVDGVTLAVGDRVLVKDQVSTFENGIYVVTFTGTVTANWVLTRSTDYNEPAEIVQYGVVLSNQGTQNASLLWEELSPGPFVIGTSPITFAEYTTASGSGSIPSITGTANQVLVNGTSGSAISGVPVTLTLPQSLATTSSPTFASMTLTGSLVAPTVLPGNLSLAGNTLSSTDANGNIYLAANGQGYIITGAGSGIASNPLAPIVAGGGLINYGVPGTRTAGVYLATYVNSSAGPVFRGYKTRATTLGSNAAVQTGDGLLNILAIGDDGVTWRTGAAIQMQVNGSVSSGIVPGQISLSTMNTSGVLTTALTISNAQAATFASTITAASSINATTGNIIANAGAMLAGASASPQGSITVGSMQAIAQGSQGNVIAASYINTAGSSPTFWTYKSRSTTVGAFATVQTGDTLGRMLFFADDGTSFDQVASIVVQAEGTISTGIVPGLMSFSTSNSSGAVTTGLTINSSQLVTAQTFRSNTTIQALSSISSGSSTGGVAGNLTLFSSTASLGSLGLLAANNAGNFANVLTNASTAAARTWTLPDASGTIALTSSASGIVNSGTQNQLTWYAATGTTVSGLATANNGILVTSAGGVPSIGNSVGADLTIHGLTVGRGGSSIATNTVLGNGAGTSFSSGNRNTAVGWSALDALTTGSNNTGYGYQAGVSGATGAATLVSGSNNTFLGYRASSDSTSGAGTIAIGADSVAPNATGLSSSDDGPGISFGSDTYRVGFAGDGTIYTGGTGRGYWKPTINGVKYLMPLFVNGTLTASASMVTDASGSPILSSAMTNGQVMIGSTGATPVAAALTAGTGISITNGAGSISIALTGLGNYSFSANTMNVSSGSMLFTSAGQSIASFTTSGTVANYLTFTSTPSASPVVIGSTGTDANVDIRYLPKAAGVHNFLSTSSTPIVLQSGTGYQRTSNFVFSNTAASYSYTFPDANGTITALGNTSTGTGSVVLASTPTLVTPILGAATATSINFGGSTLNTYTESTFTPTFTTATVGDLSVVYTNQTGVFTRIGRLVNIYYRVDCTPTFTTASGALRFAGLPFAAGQNTSGTLYSTNAGFTWTSSGTMLNLTLDAGATFMNLSSFKTNASAAVLSTADIVSGVAIRIIGNITYYV